VGQVPFGANERGNIRRVFMFYFPNGFNMGAGKDFGYLNKV